MGATVAFAARQLRAHPAGQLAGIHARHAYLALAAVCDERLDSPAGLGAVRPEAVAPLVGLARSTVARTLRSLAISDVGVVMVVDDISGRRHISGLEAAGRFAPMTIRGYRFAEAAYQPAEVR